MDRASRPSAPDLRARCFCVIVFVLYVFRVDVGNEYEIVCRLMRGLKQRVSEHS